MTQDQGYRRLVRENYRASLMSDFKWREVFGLIATYDPPLHLWIKWVDGGVEEQREAPHTLDDHSAFFTDVGRRPYLAIERLAVRAYFRGPRKSKLSSYQPIESLRDKIRSLGKLPVAGSPGGSFDIIGHLPGTAPSALTDAEIRRLGTPLDEFARMLFAAYPDWRGYAQVREGDSDPYLWVEVPPPFEADLNGPLWISAQGGEITLGIDYSHVHFGWPPDVYDDALEHVRDLIDERLVTYGQFIGEWLQCAGAEKSEDAIRVTNLQVSKLRVRSWRGTHNRDQTFAWPPSKRADL
jgi:hypothetical protein